MGIFSWITADTNESISISDSSRGAFDVYLLIPKEFGGGSLFEDDYKGYGIFGGQDAYVLLARWNSDDPETNDRKLGIELAYYNNANLKYPLFLVEDGSLTYEQALATLEPSKNCPHQGFFYD